MISRDIIPGWRIMNWRAMRQPIPSAMSVAPEEIPAWVKTPWRSVAREVSVRVVRGWVGERPWPSKS